MGPVTASSLAKELHIDRTKVYRTIDRLLAMKIVSTTLSKPKLCVANKPDDVLKRILEKKENQVDRIKKSQNEILKKIGQTIPLHYQSSLPTFHITQGTTNIYSEIEQLIENATETVYIVTTLRDLSKMYHSNIIDKIKICEKNGGGVRLLTESPDYHMIPFVRRFKATEVKIGKLSSRGRIIVESNKQMIMSNNTTGNLDSNSESDYAICTNSFDMVNNIFILCELLWKEAGFLKIS